MRRLVALVALSSVAPLLSLCFSADECNAADPLCSPVVLLSYAPIQYSLVAGDAHVCALQSTGQVRCWGQALFGANGALADIGAAPGTMPPAPLPLGGPVRHLATGEFHSCVIMVDGAVRCWGSNDQGQLGIGATANIADDPGEMPPAITALGGAALQLSLGSAHSCALMVGGAVKCWGDGAAGQLGQGSTNDIGVAAGQMPPPDIALGEAAVSIHAGGSHTCALMVSGAVKCWGEGANGRLGTENSLAIGDNPGEMPPPAINLGGSVAQVVAGEASNCARLQNGAVKCWGFAGNGRLGYENALDIGDGTGEMPPADLNLGGSALLLGGAGNGAHQCAHLASGDLKCWGFNSNGQLGQGTAIDLGGVPGNMPPPTTPISGRIYQIATGGFFTCVMHLDASVQCWGAGGTGQLGYETSAALGDGPGEMPTPFVRYR